jgi:hypothetical protein
LGTSSSVPSEVPTVQAEKNEPPKTTEPPAHPKSDAKPEEEQVTSRPSDADSKSGKPAKDASDAPAIEPKDGATTTEAKAEPELATKDVSDDQTKDAGAGTKKPDLHVDIEKPSMVDAPGSASAAATPDAVGSSVPKHMLDVDADGAATTESEAGSRPASPLAQKNQPKKKTGKASGNKKKR